MIMRIPLLRTVCKAIVAKADWEESKHPRADNGQFGSGSGGGSGSKKPSKTRRKMERREEAASQARVGGAIQSLLSGGSALDKIGWLNTSKKPSENEKKPAQQGPNSIKNPPHVDMGGVPKDKALITGSVSVSYDTKVPTKRTRFSGGEDSPSGEHAHSEDAGYITVPNVENFIHVQTHDGKSGWYPDIYNNTRRTNYYPGSKEDALTNIAAHPGAPKADELHPTLADAIASIRFIPKDYKIAPHKNNPQKPFDGAAVLEEYYRKHPDKRPPEAKPKEEAAPAKEPSRQEAPKQPEKPKAEEKPTISRPDADAWAKSSKYRADVYHVTNSKNVKNIKDNGFKQAGGQSLGASWGNGTYLALDAETADYYQRLTPNAEKLTLKVNVKNPITFDASNISDIEDGAKAIAEQIGQSEDYDRIRSELDIKNKKVEQEATAKFGRLPRAGQKLPGESNDEFITRFEDIRQKRIAFMRENGAHEFPHSDALTQVAQAAGYDAIIIRDKEFRPEVGGNQIVVFNPKDVKVVGQSENNESQDPEPETWYDSDKYQRVADTLLNNLKSGKIKVSEADKIHAEKTKSFSELTRNKNRSPSDDLKMQKISNELGAMQYALNRFKQGEPDARRRRF